MKNVSDSTIEKVETKTNDASTDAKSSASTTTESATNVDSSTTTDSSIKTDQTSSSATLASSAAPASSSATTTSSTSSSSAAKSDAPDLSNAADQIKETTKDSSKDIEGSDVIAKTETISKTVEQAKKTDTNNKKKSSADKKLQAILKEIAEKHPELRASIDLFASGDLTISGTASDGLTKNDDGTYSGILNLLFEGSSLTLTGQTGADFVIKVPAELQELFASPDFSQYISGGFEYSVFPFGSGSYQYTQSDIQVAADGSTVTFVNGTEEFAFGIKTITININIDLGRAVTDTGIVVDTSDNNYLFNSALAQHGWLVDWDILGNYDATASLITNNLMPNDNTSTTKPYVAQPVMDTSTKVTGTGEAGATIKVYNGDFSKVLGTGVVNESGYYEVNIDPQKAGTTIQVTQTINGKEGDATAVIVQHAPVTLPTPVITDAQGGKSVVKGTGNTPGNTIIITTSDGNILGKGIVDAEGNFEVETARPLINNEVIKAVETNNVDTSEEALYAVREQHQIAKPTINTVQDGDQVVTGKGETAGNTVELFDATTGESLGTSVVQENGEFIIPSKVVLKEGQIIRVVESNDTDLAGTQEAVVKAAEEVVAKPTISGDVYNDSTQISGTADPNTDIAVMVGGSQIASGRTDADGNYSITIPAQHSGTKITVVASRNGVQNESSATTVKLRAPKPNAPESGTNLVTGQGSEVGNTIRVYDANGQIGIGTVHSDGSFSITTDRELVAGETLTVTEHNDTNNIDSDPATVTVQKATVVIDAPVVNDATEGDRVVTGNGQYPGNEITVYASDGETLGSGTINDDGTFNVGLKRALVGNEKITVVESDTDGNTSPATPVTVGEQQVTIKTPVFDPAKDGDTRATGTGDTEGNLITVYGSDNKPIGVGLVNADGTFDISLSRPLVGGETITAIESDNDGNKSDVGSVIVQGQTLSKPTVNDAKDGDKMIAGKGSIAGNQINILDSTGDLLGVGLVDDDGTFNISLKRTLKEGETITAIEIDADQNQSEPGTTVVLPGDTSSGVTAPKDVIPDATNQTISGTGTPGNTISVYSEDGAPLGSGTVDEDGKFSFSANLTPGDTITVVASDGTQTSAIVTIVP